MSRRADALADRLMQGARALEQLAAGLSQAEWELRVPGDGRKIGGTVHHGGNMYPIEIDLAQALAAGKPIAGVSWDDVHAINAKHAKEFDQVTKAEAIEFLRTNSAAAAAAIRKLSDDELDRANTVSLNSDAPLTCQFFI